jgi:hypothetical protein
LELLVQPLQRDSVALFHPLECGLQLGSICMAEIIARVLIVKRKGTSTC